MAARRKIIKPKIYEKCLFCEGETYPDYKESKLLMKFLSDRGKILGRERTSVCVRHQRILSREIKRARILSLLPFIPSV